MSAAGLDTIPGVLVLPSTIATKVDVSRLVQEAERIDRNLNDRAARAKVGVKTTYIPTLSEQLSDFLAKNKLEITEKQDREKLIKHLRHLKATAPTVHITFASVPDKQSLQRIVAWLRRSVHVHAVVLVGLQPSLIGGIYVRTTNHVHDLSIRAQLAGHRDLIMQEVEALRGRK